ncbi:MAG: hypothetical protein KKA19_01835, partial [Candidatus Margulisbacteria bacterium]|nr:hypothetical protein [Candidatus Margulisiibacteriota bacterium]
MEKIYREAYSNFIRISNGDGKIDKKSADPAERLNYDEKADADKNEYLDFQEWLYANRSVLKLKKVEPKEIFREIYTNLKNLSLTELLNINDLGIDIEIQKKEILSRLPIFALSKSEKEVLGQVIQYKLCWNDIDSNDLKALVKMIAKLKEHNCWGNAQYFYEQFITAIRHYFADAQSFQQVRQIFLGSGWTDGELIRFIIIAPAIRPLINTPGELQKILLLLREGLKDVRILNDTYALKNFGDLLYVENGKYLPWCMALLKKYDTGGRVIANEIIPQCQG